MLYWAGSFPLLEVGGVLVLAFWGFLVCLGLGVLVEEGSCSGRDEVDIMLLYLILFGLGHPVSFSLVPVFLL